MRSSRNGSAASAPFAGLVKFGLLRQQIARWPGCSTAGVPGAAVNAGSPGGLAALRVGGEVMVERDVLVEDHHQVLDRRRGRQPGREIGAAGPRGRHRAGGRGGEARGRGGKEAGEQGAGGGGPAKGRSMHDTSGAKGRGVETGGWVSGWGWAGRELTMTAPGDGPRGRPLGTAKSHDRMGRSAGRNRFASHSAPKVGGQTI